ncbi:tyrosine-type recombinase/integrase [Nonomuraea maheshkhaliensis]|uniref:Tyrosine-type recombinase/integrase n=1 Tax=Nonomuraea maheshkhaliensis TaxID=419590 RepID=A0ABP4R1G1_9ACTN
MTASLPQALKEYLAMRRALGYKLQRPGQLLAQFVAYLAEHDTDVITIDHALAWATLPATASPRWWALRLSAVRSFAAYLHVLNPAHQVVPPGLLGPAKSRATPYLYTDAEIDSLMEAAARLPSPLNAATYRTLLGLLTVTGLRIGEAIALDVADLDAEHDVLTIRNTKFGKDRLVPLHASTTGALRAYLDQSRRLCPGAPAGPLLISTRGTRLRHVTVSATFGRLVKGAGLSARSASCRPRIHDLRHSFAVRTLLEWYRHGADVPALLPRLSTYLGHIDPGSTYWYLSAAPELLALAGQRLEAHLQKGSS